MALEPITRKEKIIAGQDLTPITRMEKFLKNFGGGSGAGSSVQSDWNQNDNTQLDYVKNRPFYSEVTETILVEESTVSFTSPATGIYYATIQSDFKPTAEETYKVSWDGAAYECVCKTVSGYNMIGNLSIMGVGEDTGEPFAISPLADDSGIEIYTSDTSASHTFSISRLAGEVVKIPDKYISNTFRDVLNAGNPLLWSDDEWGNYYALFLGGKILQITTDFGSTKIGYALSMSFGNTRRITFIDPIGNIYRLGYNSKAGEIYWQPVFASNDGIYLEYIQDASNPTESTLEYAILSKDNEVLKFTTHKANEDVINRKVVLEGDKELILSSSTAGSAKKFKITVDDSGTISATEVTE